MSGNSFGNIFKLTTFGESHGPALGGVLDGCPAGLKLDMDFINQELQRRKPGQSRITTQRKEEDEVRFLSGIKEGVTTGTPIGFIIENTNAKGKDYSHIEEVYRPSHADFTYQEKYGIREHRGGGRSSARETACRVVGGAIAKLLLQHSGVTIHAFVSQVGDIKMENILSFDPNQIEQNAVRCPDQKCAEAMEQRIQEIRKAGDTIGGQVSCVIEGTPVGLGEPVFLKLHSELGRAMLSINAVKGFEYGSGFASIKMKGSEHNDIFEKVDGKIKTQTNYSGGVQGGISNGEKIYFNVAFKPVATIMQDQASIDKEGNKKTVQGKGRHDPCVVPRAVPIVEAMAALVLADFLLLNKTSQI